MVVFFDLFSLLGDDQHNVTDCVLLHTGNYEVESLEGFNESIMSQLTQVYDIWTYHKKSFYTEDYCYYTLIILGPFPNHKQYSDFIQCSFDIPDDIVIGKLKAPASSDCLVMVDYCPMADEIKTLLMERAIDAEISAVDNQYNCGADSEEIIAVIRVIGEFAIQTIDIISQLLFLKDETIRKFKVDKLTQEMCRKYILDNYEVDKKLLSFIGVSPGDNGKVVVYFRTRYHEYILDTLNKEVVAAQCKQIGLDY